jgi:DNA-binding FadR family transcriptional regulator
VSLPNLGTARSREVLRKLRENIVSGRWPVNSRIPTESELMAEFAVGRSTIREAVHALASIGMLEPARSRGTFVRSRNPVSGVLADSLAQHEVADVLATRRALEVEAARLAASNRTAKQLAALRRAHEWDVPDTDAGVERGGTPGEFHALLLEASGNRLLAELHSSLLAALRGLLVAGRVRSGITDTERREDHAELLAAVGARDPARAAQVAGAHADRDMVIARPRRSPARKAAGRAKS